MSESSCVKKIQEKTLCSINNKNCFPELQNNFKTTVSTVSLKNSDLDVFPNLLFFLSSSPAYRSVFFVVNKWRCSLRVLLTSYLWQCICSHQCSVTWSLGSVSFWASWICKYLYGSGARFCHQHSTSKKKLRTLISPKPYCDFLIPLVLLIFLLANWRKEQDRDP